MKAEFTRDFDFAQPGALRLHNLISKLKNWIKILEIKTRQLPKTFLIEDKCRFLSNFSQKTADVELPGELLMPRHSHYHIRIARFMPRVEIVQKHNTTARRLYIRGTNGKIYPYLVVNDSGLGDAAAAEGDEQPVPAHHGAARGAGVAADAAGRGQSGQRVAAGRVQGRQRQDGHRARSAVQAVSGVLSGRVVRTESVINCFWHPQVLRTIG